MNCHDFEARIDRYLGEGLPARERDDCDAHLVGCAECAAILQALQVDAAGGPDLLPFLKAHRLADELLPEFAQLDPGPGFTKAVLRRTRLRTRARRLRHRASQWWVRQLERPQFASEFAYALTVLMALAVLVPASPLASLSRDALDGLRTSGDDEASPGWVESGIVPVVTAPVHLVDAGERLGASVGSELETRTDALGVVFELGGHHAKEIAGAVWERDWDALRPLLTQMRCDLRLLWDATRGTISSDDEEAFRC